MFNAQAYLNDYVRVLQRLDRASIERVVEVIVGAWFEKRTVFLCGNGGSAASASHIAADLAKLTTPPSGPRLRAVSLTESTAAISAIANDIAYEDVFTEQLRTFCQPRDVVVGLSTSGSSPNVLRAVELANSVGAITVGITGRAGHRLREIAHCSIIIDSTSVQHIEDATMVAGHMVCLRVKDALRLVNASTLVRPVAAGIVANASVRPAAMAP